MKIVCMLFNNSLIEYTKNGATTDPQFITVIEEILKNIETLVTQQKNVSLQQVTIDKKFISVQRTFLCLVCGVIINIMIFNITLQNDTYSFNTGASGKIL